MTIDARPLPGLVPPGPGEKYDSSRQLLGWLMQNMAEFGSVYRAFLFGAYAYVVSEPRLVDHVLRENWQNYRKGRDNKRVALLLDRGLMVSEGELWKKQRRMIQPVFHPDAVVRLWDVLVNSSNLLLAKWTNLAAEHQPINITRETSLWVLEVVLRSLFGEDYGAVAPKFETLSTESTRDLEFAQKFRSLRKVVSDVIEDRRQTGRISVDILGMLMEARDRVTGTAMPDGQLLSEMMTLVVAGHETTASTLSWFWYLLSEHPAVEASLSQELSQAFPKDLDGLAAFPRTRQALEETMRLYPPGWLLTRRAINDDLLGDYFVPAGTEIYISPYLIQRNPSLWESPEVFDPDRFSPEQVAHRHPLASLPFSAGPRKCVGELLARTEMQIHAMTVAPKLRLHWISGDPTDIEAGVNLRCRQDLIFAAELKS
ncbi:MAG: cytochrome P450 [Acidobacteriaceae bacterium]